MESHPYRSRWVVVLMLVLLVCTAGVGTGWAQVLDSSRVLTATLLTRLGEAVDGYRTGRPVYVVAAYEFPHNVLGVFTTRAEAAAVVRAEGPRFGLFGPYSAPPDVGEQAYFFVTQGLSVADTAKPKCPNGQIHRPDSFCPPYRGDTTVTVLPFRDIREIRITVRTIEGREFITAYAPSEIDAVFFTMSAIDKFVMPYYTEVYGAEFAARIRRDYLEYIERGRRR